MKFNWSAKNENFSKFTDDIIDSGWYLAKIAKCFSENNSYYVDKHNPDGLCVSIWFDISLPTGDSKRIFQRISATNPSAMNSVLKAAGLKTLEENDELDEKSLIGKTINAFVEKYTSSRGKVSNVISQYEQSGKDSVEF